ncbi:hypothetical protein Mapa_004299 [Marchantia paleacea]|nr:hypothetical protein Mapa_004299 [Marchantia paleacea]
MEETGEVAALQQEEQQQQQQQQQQEPQQQPCPTDTMSFQDLVNSADVKTPGQGAAEWTDVAVATFLDCFAEKYSNVKHKNLRGKDWMEVVDGLNKRCAPEGGPYYEYKQCRNKLDGLKKRFRQEKDSLSTNSHPSRWQWYPRMCDLKWARNMKMMEHGGGSGRGDKPEMSGDQAEGDGLVPDEKDVNAADRAGEVSMEDDAAWNKFRLVSTFSPKQKRKRRRAYVFNPSVPEIVAEGLRPRADLLPPCTPDNMSTLPDRPPLMQQFQKMPSTDRTFKLRIRRPNEADCDDIFHFTGETVSDMIESFKAVYWEEPATQIRVQLKEKFTEVWVTVAPSVSLSQYGSEALIITKPRGAYMPLTSTMASAPVMDKALTVCDPVDP